MKYAIVSLGFGEWWIVRSVGPHDMWAYVCDGFWGKVNFNSWVMKIEVTKEVAETICRRKDVQGRFMDNVELAESISDNISNATGDVK